eukprot:gene9895-11610_t
MVNSIEVVEYLAAIWSSAGKNDAKIMNTACSYGRLKCVKVLRREGFKWGPKCIASAAQYGHCDCLEFAHTNHCPWEASTVHGCPADSYAWVWAAEDGQLESLRILHEFQVPWDVEASDAAAESEEFECIQYLHEIGCPWKGDTLSWSTCKGRVDILQYAMEEGCNHFDDLVEVTVNNGQLPCLQYLVESQGLYMQEDGLIFAEALLGGHLSCVMYLMDQGCPSNITGLREPDPRYGYSYGSNDTDVLACLEYAVGHGWSCSPIVRDYFLKEGMTLCLDYLVNAGQVKPFLAN